MTTTLVEVRGGIAEVSHGTAIVIDWDDIGNAWDDALNAWKQVETGGFPPKVRTRVREMLKEIWPDEMAATRTSKSLKAVSAISLLISEHDGSAVMRQKLVYAYHQLLGMEGEIDSDIYNRVMSEFKTAFVPANVSPS